MRSSVALRMVTAKLRRSLRGRLDPPRRSSFGTFLGDESRFNSSQLTSEEKPSFSGGNEAVPATPIGVFRLR
jgi:hypothetical protein